MSKRMLVFIVVLIALAISGCSHQTPAPTATPVPPTATPVPPTATSVPPTATPVPPTATAAPPAATATRQAWRLDDVTTWDLKPYERGKEPQPQNTVLLADDGTALQAFYIGNPEVREYFVNLAKQNIFDEFGPGHGKGWIVNYAAFQQKWIIKGSPADKGAQRGRQRHLDKGVYAEFSPSPLDSAFAYFWEAWVVYDPTEHIYSVVTRWVQRPHEARFYHLSDDSLDRANQVVDPVESFTLWRLDKDGKWRRWAFDMGWLHADTPKPAVYDPAP